MLYIRRKFVDGNNPFLTKPEIVLFDMDGTLVDNSDVVADAYYYGMIELGYQPILRDEIKQLFGRSTFETGRGMGLQEKDLPKIDQYFWDYFGSYAKNLNGKPNVYKAVPEILELFTKNNIRMGICTSNESKSAKILMEKAGLEDYFEVYIGSEDLEERKPSPKPLLLALDRLNYNYLNKQNLSEKIWFVGDTKYDIDAAHNASMLSIGILHESTGKLMISANPDVLVDSIDDLYNTINAGWSS
jgi:phosphoglycolate phosphatase